MVWAKYNLMVKDELAKQEFKIKHINYKAYATPFGNKHTGL